MLAVPHANFACIPKMVEGLLNPAVAAAPEREREKQNVR